MIWNDSEENTQTESTTWCEIAELLGEPRSIGDIGAALAATGGDVTAMARRLFPALPVEALHEVVWAIGERERRECLLGC